MNTVCDIRRKSLALPELVRAMDTIQKHFSELSSDEQAWYVDGVEQMFARIENKKRPDA